MSTIKTLLNNVVNNSTISREGNNYTLHFGLLKSDTAEKIYNLLSQNNFKIVKFRTNFITVTANSQDELREKLSKIDYTKEETPKKSHETGVKTLKPSKASNTTENIPDIPPWVHEAYKIFETADKSCKIDEINEALTKLKKIRNNLKELLSKKCNDIRNNNLKADPSKDRSMQVLQEYFANIARFIERLNSKNENLLTYKTDFENMLKTSFDNAMKKSTVNEINDSIKYFEFLIENVGKDSKKERAETYKNCMELLFDYRQKLKERLASLNKKVQEGLDNL